MPDSYDPGLSLAAPRRPLALAERFLAPSGFVWGHLPAADPRAECIFVGGYGDFIEKHFETVRDLAARGLSVWCLDWRGQGGSTRPRRLPQRPRPRHFDRDAVELAQF